MTTTTHGSTPDFDLATPLHTDEDVLRRIDLLVDRDARQLYSAWLLFVTVAGLQLPVVVPVDLPVQPDPHLVSSLSWLVSEALRQNVPGGSAVVVLTRPGDVAPNDADRAWATKLHRSARERSACLRMICLATPAGTCRLSGDAM
ncbi:MAG: hypothetical protein J2P28_06600 [Actinobacteria bacterium]|nr:hypothetical protein [Actinomycetota bacterium]